MAATSFMGRLREATRRADVPYRKSYAFFLGAGCSVSSGIPASGPLVEKIWLPEWRSQERNDAVGLAAWAKQILQQYDPGDPAASFGGVLEKYFAEGDAARQPEIERLCDGKLPGFGYWVLASLIVSQPEQFGLVLTTNFDDLIADAVYLRSGSRPLVISHAELAQLIPLDRPRPLVIKLHGDHRLAPRGTVRDTETLRTALEKRVRSLLEKAGGLVFIGYGGRDKDIVGLLSGLPRRSWGVYWCNGLRPQGDLAAWLEKMDAHWVPASDFDELMLLAMDRFELEHPNPDRFGRFALDRYMRTYGRIGRRATSPALRPADENPVKAAFYNTFRKLPTCEWKYLLSGSWADSATAKDMLEDGLKAYDNSPSLHCAYASLMLRTERDREAAETHLRKAVSLDPEHIDSGVTLTRYLSEALGLDDAARDEFERLKRLNPRDASFWARYAEFVKRTSPNDQGYKQAEDYYRRALRADVYDAEALGLYASFLGRVRNDAERADKYFRDAVDLLDPDSANRINLRDNLRNYAAFLASQGESAAAEDYFQQALEVDATDPTTLGSFAAFLARTKPGDPRIAAFIQTALDIDPSQKDAFELCRQAFESDPADVRRRVRYASASLGQGRRPEGWEVLAPLISSKTGKMQATTRDLRAECWFLALVHFPEEQETAIRKLGRTLGAVPPLLGRTLRAHLEQARNDPLVGLFREVAAVLVGTQVDREVLDDYDLWRRLTSRRRDLRLGRRSSADGRLKMRDTAAV